MKIGIFLHPYGEREPAGLGRALLDMTASLIARSPRDEFMIFVKGNPKIPPPFSGTNWSMHSCGEGVWWRDRALARTSAPDVCFFMTPVMPIARCPQKSLVMALDFAYLALPARGVGDFFRKYVVRLAQGIALRACDGAIAISSATRRDAIRFFGIPEQKIRTVHLGYRRICDGGEASYDVPEKFFLFVGVMKERKNVRAIIKAFDRFAGAHPNYHLLLAGKADGEYGQLARRDADKNNAAERIRFLGYRTDAELAFLYRRATALVYPSKLEGFGFPVLEAMQCGTVVITSRVSSLPELAGDAALLVDPDNVDEIASAMARVADDPALRAELVARGRAQAEKFSWEKCAREVLHILHSL